jgi:hypothetical protein
MTDLLESVQTSRLRSAFEKYLPSVINSNGKEAPAKQKKALTEGKEVTGNRETTATTGSKNNNNANVVELRRLAGLN